MDMAKGAVRHMYGQTGGGIGVTSGSLHWLFRIVVIFQVGKTIIVAIRLVYSWMGRPKNECERREREGGGGRASVDVKMQIDHSTYGPHPQRIERTGRNPHRGHILDMYGAVHTP